MRYRVTISSAAQLHASEQILLSLLFFFLSHILIGTHKVE